MSIPGQLYSPQLASLGGLLLLLSLAPMGCADNKKPAETGAVANQDAGQNPGAQPRTFSTPWDWSGVVGTGQSLAVGEPGPERNTPAVAAVLTEQPYQNLQLSTGQLPWPVDPNDSILEMIPLTEPIGRRSGGYPSSWPTNIAGETPHAAMGNQISALMQTEAGQEYIGVHTEVGENGQCLSLLEKNATEVGVTGRAYEATMVEIRAIARLAEQAGKTYGVGAITVTHGECDAGNADYAAQLHQLWSNYREDIAAITRQQQPPLMIVSQQHSINDRAASTLAQWKIGVDYPTDVVCSGPKYQYLYASDAIHLGVAGYEQLGEKYGQIYYERVILGRDWQPLQPLGVSREGQVITVQFQVPSPPLVWENTFEAPHQETLTEWSEGKGFEVRSGTAPVEIVSVEIDGDSIRITCASDLPDNGVTVGYALSENPTAMATPFAGTTRWGQLRDSDAFVGSTTQKAQPNFSVAFELPVP